MSTEALDSAPSCGDDHGVRFPWQPQEYTRTCAQCGYIWEVPRWARQRRGRLVSMFVAAFAVIATLADAHPGDTAGTVKSISDQNRLAEALGHCPECDADHITQRASGNELLN